MKIKNLLVTTLAVAAGLTLTACQSDKSEGASTSQEGEAVTLNFGAMGLSIRFHSLLHKKMAILKKKELRLI